MIRIVKCLLVAEGLILITQYVKDHTYEKIYEREQMWEDGKDFGTELTSEMGDVAKDGANTEDEVYGVGFEPKEGMFFLFHKRTETENLITDQPETE